MIKQYTSTSIYELGPPSNESNRIRVITETILEKIYGPPDTIVSIEYFDGNGDTHLEKFVRAKRKSKMDFDDTLPPFYMEFERKRLV